LRIIFISYHYWPPNFGGELIISIERFQELVKRGHQVTVLTAGRPGNPEFENRDGIEIHRSPHIHSSKVGRGIRRLVFPLWAAVFLKSHTPDIVHLGSAGGIDVLTSNLASWHLARAAQKVKAPMVRVHSLADTAQEAFTMSGIKGRLRSLYLNRVEAIVSVSPALHKGVEVYYPEKAILIPCGVRNDIILPLPAETRLQMRKDNSAGENEVIFTFLGSLGRRKGFDVLAEAFAAHSESHPDWKLWVIGPRSVAENQNINPEEVKQVCAPLDNLKNQVRYWGRVDDRAELAKILGVSDIFVFPSIKEGFGLAPVEAMAVGIPVIVSRLPGITDLANVEGETGLFIEPGSVQSLMDTMVKLAGAPELRAQMGAAGYRRVRDHFGWQQHVTNWENLYKNLMTKNLTRR
jgi:glycosyltransferase involved in cell wall biosynthesis